MSLSGIMQQSKKEFPHLEQVDGNTAAINGLLAMSE